MTTTACPGCGTRNRVPIDAAGTPRCAQCKADLPWLADATMANFDAALSTSKLPILVDLWAPWCGPCHTIAPVLEGLAAERAGSLRVLKVNIDDEPAIAQRLGVQSIPTMVLFDRGQEVGRQIGAQPAAAIAHWIDSIR